MKQAKLIEFKLDEQIYKRIKKNRKVIHVLNDNKKLSKLDKNSKVLLINADGKKIKRKIKKVYFATDLKELKKYLGKKVKYITVDSTIIKEDKVIAFEIKKNVNVIWKILGFLFLLCLLFVSWYFLSVHINEGRNEKLIDKIEDIKQEEVYYVSVRINPWFLIHLKNDKVVGVTCNNTDCTLLKYKLHIEGMSLEDAILRIYEVSDKAGYDTSKGVEIYSSIYLEKTFESYDFIHVNITSKKEMDKIVDDSEKFDDDFKRPEESYNKKMFETLKKDSDYGKYYTCTLDNDYLDCRFVDNLVLWFEEDFEPTKWAKILPNMQGVKRTLEKFGAKVTEKEEFGLSIPLYKVDINGINYSFYSKEDDSTVLKDYYLGYQKNPDCSYEDDRIKLIDINLADMSVLRMEHHIGKTGYSQFGSASNYLCGKKLCLKRTVVDRKSKYNYNTCDYELISDIYYYSCDLNKKNCKEIKEDEYWEDYHPNHGYLMDLDVCHTEETFYIPDGVACRTTTFDDYNNFVGWAKVVADSASYNDGITNSYVIEYNMDPEDIPFEY